MVALQSKVTAYRIVFLGLTKESLDGASDSLDGDGDLTTFDWSAQHDSHKTK